MAMTRDSVEEVIRIIMRRDGLSYNEARVCVEDCIAELDRVIERGGSYEEAVDVIYYALSLEPDYLEFLID